MPLVWIKYPFRAGDTWEASVAGGKAGRLKSQCVTSAPEAVEVPAGKYTAIRIDVEYERDGRKRKFTDWYAAGVGRVKRMSQGTGDSEVLTAFTPGKD